MSELKKLKIEDIPGWEIDKALAVKRMKGRTNNEEYIDAFAKDGWKGYCLGRYISDVVMDFEPPTFFAFMNLLERHYFKKMEGEAKNE